jgi:hypothetical protein
MCDRSDLIARAPKEDSEKDRHAAPLAQPIENGVDTYQREMEGRMRLETNISGTAAFRSHSRLKTRKMNL